MKSQKRSIQTLIIEQKVAACHQILISNLKSIVENLSDFECIREVRRDSNKIIWILRMTSRFLNERILWSMYSNSYATDYVIKEMNSDCLFSTMLMFFVLFSKLAALVRKREKLAIAIKCIFLKIRMKTFSSRFRTET